MRLFKDLNYGKKMMLICVLPLIIISICIGSMSYARARQSAVDAWESSMQDGINRVDMAMSDRAREIDGMMDVVSQLYMELDEDNMWYMCQEMMSSLPEIRSVNIVQGGKLRFSTRDDAVLQEELLIELEESKVERASGTVWSDMEESFFDDSGRPTIHVTCNVSPKTEYRGILVVEVDPASLTSRLLSKQKVVQSQTTMVLDRQFDVIGRLGSMDEELKNLAQAEYKAGRRSFDVSYNERNYYCLMQYNALTGWVMMTIVDKHDLFAGGDDLRDYILSICLMFIVLAIVVVRFMSYRATKPLTALSQAMKRVQMHNLNVHLPNDRHDEIGELTDSFNFMTDRIEGLIENITEERMAQQTAQIEALQAQINPHFLYNTLDSINWMLIERGDMDVSNIIVALGKLMRYSMTSSVSFVPLSDEYQNILDYLKIQKNRLEDRLLFELELDNDLRDVEVPKLILQPLVENSIKYAMRKSDQILTIKVYTYLADPEDNEIVRQIDHDGPVACITVENDGEGMNEEQLQNYWSLLNAKNVEATSIGIKNVVKRLQLLFDNKCRFEVESSPESGTITRLYLPVAGGNDEDRNH